LPPETKVSKQAIMEATFAITREAGFEKVNARSLAERIGCSTQPIYSRFNSMVGVKRAFLAYLEASFIEYVQRYAPSGNPLLQTMVAYVSFAHEQPNLFKLLFMERTAGTQTLGRSMRILERLAVVDRTKAEPETARQMGRQMLYHAHGMAVMLATGNLVLSDGEITRSLESMYSMLRNSIPTE